MRRLSILLLCGLLLFSGAAWASGSSPGIPKTATQAEAEAGTATTLRSWTPERVKQAVVALSSAASGDVTGAGDCADGACLDGSSDGGTYIRLYDGTSAYIEALAGVRTLTIGPSNANAEKLLITFGNNDNTLALTSSTGATVSISGTAANASLLETHNAAYFQTALTYPVTGVASPTSGNLVKWGASGNTLEDSLKIGTFTDTKWCSYSTANGFQCTENSPAGGHDAVTLSADLGTSLLGLSTQELTIDDQSANKIFAGPATGAAAAPTFRDMVLADIPATIARLAGPTFTGTTTVNGILDFNGVSTSQVATFDQTTDIDGGAVTLNVVKVTSTITDSTAHNLSGSILKVVDSNVVDAGGTNTMLAAEFVSGASPSWSNAGAGDVGIENDLEVRGSAWVLGTLAPTTFNLPSSNADPAAVAGQIRHDSTVTNFTNGALRYYNGAAIKQLIDMTAATAEGCTDDQVVAYDADNDLWYCKDDANSGSATALDAIADAGADGTIAQTGYKQTFTSTLNSAGAVWTFTNTTADLTADVSFFDLKYTDDGDANGFFMRGYDNAGGDLKWSIAADGAASFGSVTASGADGSNRVVITNNTAISPTASADELYPEANIWKVNQNGTESSVVIGPTAGQVTFAGPSQARTVTIADAAQTLLNSTATGVQTFLTTPSSANLAAALTDETGTGVAVFGTSPAITTAITPAAAGGSTIGTTALEWGNVYLTDSAVIYGQANQGNTMTSSATGWTFNLPITLANGESISNADDTEITFVGTEAISLDLDTGTANQVAWKNRTTSTTGVTNMSFSDLNLVTTGTIQGKIVISSDADGMSAADMTTVGLDGTLFIATGAGTWILPDVAAAGSALCLMDSGTAHDLILDVTAGSTIRLKGTEQADGVGITNASGTSTGDFVCVVSVAAHKWSTMGMQGTWASQ
jgi:hypothetical protein